MIDSNQIASLDHFALVVSVVFVGVAVLLAGRLLAGELRAHRNSLRSLEARLRGLEDVLIAIYKENRAREREDRERDKERIP